MGKFLKLFAVLIALSLVAAPGYSAEKVEMAYVEWACATASTHLAKAVIEDKLGYEVEITPVAASAMWQATATGDVDGFVAAWLPVTHQDYLQRFEKDVVNLGKHVAGAKIGLVVPKYVTIDSIADLNKNTDKFNGKIVGIDPGAGIMSKAEKALKEYNMDEMELVEGSGAIMTATLGNAIKNKEWVVVTGWTPHWKFGRWDLKYLKDPKGVFGSEEHISAVVRKGLKKDKPKVYNFLDNFVWDLSTMQTLMSANQENGKPLENARKFIKENPDLVNKWLGKSK